MESNPRGSGILCHFVVGRAQNAQLSGIVRDASGAVVARAEVSLTDQTTQRAVRSVTNGSGIYSFSALQPSHYTLQVAAAGFTQKTVINLVVEVGAHLSRDLSLHISSKTDTVPGLPSAHEKTFFFFSYEGLRLTNPVAATLYQVPSNELRASAPAALKPFLSAFPVSPGADLGGTSAGLANYTAGYSAPSRLDTTSIRIDHSVTDRFKLFGRYSDVPSQSTSRQATDLAQVNATTRNVKSVVLGASNILSNSLVNDLRFGLTGNDYKSNRYLDNFGGATPLAISSAPGLDNGDWVTFFLFYGLYPYYLVEPQSNRQRQINGVDSLSQTAGRHALKYGVDYRCLVTSEELPPLWEVAFYLDEASILSNTPAGLYVYTQDISVKSLLTNFSAFAQDEWRVTIASASPPAFAGTSTHHRPIRTGTRPMPSTRSPISAPLPLPRGAPRSITRPSATLPRVQVSPTSFIAIPATRLFSASVGASSVGPVTANYRAVSFNPATGQVLDDTTRFSGVLGFFTNLHFYLLAGKSGLQVSGWMALALLLLCITGLILWWPGVRRSMSALVLHRRTSWRRFNWDLHSVVGFWTCLPLLLVTFTGLYFAFPKPVATLTILASGGSLTQARTSDEPAPQAVHPAASESAAAASTFSVDDALTRARQLLPVAAPPAYLTLPGPRASSYYVTGYYRSSAPFAAGERDLRRPYRGSSQPHGHSRADPR